MKNEITIYELLGLVKDGKAPKLIRWNNKIWEFKERYDDYFGDECYLIIHGFDFYENSKEFLNDKVEVIEEHKHTIEKLNIESENNINFYIKNEFGTKCCLTKHSKIIAEKLNEIIDYIQEKENK